MHGKHDHSSAYQSQAPFQKHFDYFFSDICLLQKKKKKQNNLTESRSLTKITVIKAIQK